MGWTLPEVRDLDTDEWDALVAWVRHKADRQNDSMDADAVVDAMKAKKHKANGPE